MILSNCVFVYSIILFLTAVLEYEIWHGLHEIWHGMFAIQYKNLGVPSYCTVYDKTQSTKCFVGKFAIGDIKVSI